jgi:nitrogen fixation protein FixH
MTMQTRCKGLMGAAITIAVIVAAGCNSQQSNQAPPQTSAPATSAPSPADVTFKTTPDPAKTGENTFEVMVMQDGKPVTDANVSVELYMAAMPQMKMPEMKNKVDLMHAGDGVYRGTGQVMMAGNWDVTVMAMRGGQEIATKKMPLTAK